MKFVAPLTEQEQITLRDMRDHHPKSRMRMRAHSIILSHQGYELQEIALFFEVSRQTVSTWFDSWDSHGIGGLYENARSGHPMSLSEEDVQFAMNLIEQEPRSTKAVVAALEEQRGKKVCIETIKRTLKKAKFRWKRVRKSTKPKRDEQKFQSAKCKINLLEQRRIQGEIDILYFDGSGFCLTPSIPYAWQPTGKFIELPATGNHGQRLNVIAFMNKENDLIPFCFDGSINTEAIVGCFDSISETLTKKTFVIIDNAPAHRSKAFIKNLAKWHKRGLIPKFLPSYSPELNLIEILWKKMKYEWLPFSSYLSFKALKEAVDIILKVFGSKYVINFSA
jgi:transposase